MCCEPRGHHGRSCGSGHHLHRSSCGCGGHSHHGRRFRTREEKIAWLEEYLEDLTKEAQAVEEHVAEMKGQG